MTDDELPPILVGKRYDSPSSFTPESLLREARRQKSVSIQPVPDVCLLDPDGDIIRRLNVEGRMRPCPRHRGFAPLHTPLGA